MTTVAYKDGVIACDSRSTSGWMVVSDDSDKRQRHNGATFVMCGRPDQYDEFIRAYFSDNKEIQEDNECSAIVLDDGIYLVSQENKKLFRYEIGVDKIYAIGSGADHAWTAMDMGASAAEAIKWAMKRDTATGGKVRTVKVK